MYVYTYVYRQWWWWQRRSKKKETNRSPSDEWWESLSMHPYNQLRFVSFLFFIDILLNWSNRSCHRCFSSWSAFYFVLSRFIGPPSSRRVNDDEKNKTKWTVKNGNIITRRIRNVTNLRFIQRFSMSISM